MDSWVEWVTRQAPPCPHAACRNRNGQSIILHGIYHKGEVCVGGVGSLGTPRTAACTSDVLPFMAGPSRSLPLTGTHSRAECGRPVPLSAPYRYVPGPGVLVTGIAALCRLEM